MLARTQARTAMLALGASAAAFVACGTDVRITAETTGSSQASGSSSGGTTMGGTGGAGGSSMATSTSSSTGGPPPVQKMVTAETDMAQYQSFTVLADAQVAKKVLDGPFFVTDAAGSIISSGAVFFLGTNGDCSTQTDTVLQTNASNLGAHDIHGMRMPVLPGQTLCLVSGSYGGATVMGFRPY